MSAVEDSVMPSRAPAWRLALQRAIVSPRFAVYVSCTLLAVLTSWLLGKDMQWDTMHYHFYAGFSALHDRFGLDYFAAGVQSYLNPYAYVPFYLLATSGLTTLEVATIFAVIHSGILWLSYELAIAVAPPDQPRTRVAIGVCAAVFAFLNPVLIDQFGSSYADVTTAELALAGCLLLVRAVRAPGAWCIACSGALIGAAAALKLTNALMAVSVAIVPLFLPVEWRKRLGLAALLGLCIGASFALVAAPWSIRLEQHFSNPFFPLLNSLFRSPQFTTGSDTDALFIPPSLRAALWRPFAIATQVRMVHYETPAPDLRYAILLIVGALALLGWLLHRLGRRRLFARQPHDALELRPLVALGCAFAVAWSLWLSISGNSRYFLSAACVAAVLAVALLFHVLVRWPRLRICVVAVVLLAQVYRVDTGAAFRAPLPWNKGPWFDVRMPAALASEPALYFSVGGQSNAFVVPFLAPGSGSINLDGGYVLGPAGENGAHIQELMKQFSTRLRVIVEDDGVHADRDIGIPHPIDVDDILYPFGLQVDEGHCAKIVVPYAPTVQVITFDRAIPQLPLSHWDTRYLLACRLMPNGTGFGAVPQSERVANLVLDRLEDECPAVLVPRRPITFPLNGKDNRMRWVRRYGSSHVAAWVGNGELSFQAVVGRDTVHDLGSVGEWEKSPPRVMCGRRADGMFFVRVAPQ